MVAPLLQFFFTHTVHSCSPPHLPGHPMEVKMEKDKGKEKMEQGEGLKGLQGYMDDAVVWKEENEGSEDRISELPDAILHIVLSYLNTEDAVRTSVLSKRWRGVWAHAPNLEFAQNHHLKLADFVNQSLLHYRGSRIQKFCLFMYIEQYCNVGHVWDPRSGLH